VHLSHSVVIQWRGQDLDERGDLRVWDGLCALAQNFPNFLRDNEVFWCTFGTIIGGTCLIAAYASAVI